MPEREASAWKPGAVARKPSPLWSSIPPYGKICSRTFGFLRAKSSARPVFHFQKADAKETFMSELKGFLEEYRHASDALQSGQMEAVDWFPEGSYRPQLPFLGSPAPPRPPSPPTRPIEIEEIEKVKRVVARGAVPVVEVPVVETGRRDGSASADHPP